MSRSHQPGRCRGAGRWPGPVRSRLRLCSSARKRSCEVNSRPRDTESSPRIPHCKFLEAEMDYLKEHATASVPALYVTCRYLREHPEGSTTDDLGAALHPPGLIEDVAE